MSLFKSVHFIYISREIFMNLICDSVTKKVTPESDLISIKSASGYSLYVFVSLVCPTNVPTLGMKGGFLGSVAINQALIMISL